MLIDTFFKLNSYSYKTTQCMFNSILSTPFIPIDPSHGKELDHCNQT